jgi:hypothetical protein
MGQSSMERISSVICTVMTSSAVKLATFSLPISSQRTVATITWIKSKKNRSIYMIEIPKWENKGWCSPYEQVDQGLCSP